LRLGRDIRGEQLATFVVKRGRDDARLCAQRRQHFLGILLVAKRQGSGAVRGDDAGERRDLAQALVA
jgi:hypothetical protein